MSRTYEELKETQPEVTYAEFNISTEGALRAICDLLTPAQISVIPNLSGWLAYQKWWESLSLDERKTIFEREWKYD